MNSNDGDDRRDIGVNYSDNRGYISVDYLRSRFISQETNQSYSLNHVETVSGDWRDGYRYHTSRSSSHNPGDHGRQLHLSLDSNCVHKSIYYNEIGDIHGESVDGDGIF